MPQVILCGSLSETPSPVVASGLTFLEGPVRWDPDGRTRTLRAPNHMANGQTLDREGRLVTCEHATSRAVRTEHDGRESVLAGRFEAASSTVPTT